MKNRVIAAMSGGVDSSVTAALLVEQGYDVIGLTMHLWDFEKCGGNVYKESGCCSMDSIDRARKVCHQLNIPHYVINFKSEFEEEVISDFIEQYFAGKTPNPCVICNTRLKWHHLLRKGESLGAEYIATGHYARKVFNEQNGCFELHKGVDEKKDQSYALWGLTQEMLRKTIFPAGEMIKKDLRKYAKKRRLKSSETKESQEICFIPDDDYNRFLNEKVPGLVHKLKNGKILSSSGKELGEHKGYPFYTIGQRKGLGIAMGYPVYVKRINPENNTITVATDDELYTGSLTVQDINYINGESPAGSFDCVTKIRYNDDGTESTFMPDGEERAVIRFRSPVRAVTPGQSAVFYDGSKVIGGGIIEKEGE